MHLEQHPPTVFDMRLALTRLDGDTQLLAEVAALFLADWPERRADLRAALAGGNSRALELAAHEVKGAVALFGALPAFAAAQALEAISRNKDSEGAEDLFREMEREVERLCLELEQLIGGTGL